MIKKTSLLLLLTFLIINFSNVQASNLTEEEKNKIKEELIKIYDDFEKSVVEKDKELHESLYLYDSAPVNVVVTTGNGPMDYYSNDLQGWMNFFSRPDMPYELKISEEKYEIINDALAISEARFDEYNTNKYTSKGIDIFTYIKSDKGWKFLTLHNTVTHIEDTNDYSNPMKFEISVDDIREQFQQAVKNRDREKLTSLFHSTLNPYISMKDQFNGDFYYPHHSIGGTINRIVRGYYQLELEFSNVKKKFYDNYICVMTMDAKLLGNGKELSNGTHTWILYPTANSGWKISAIVSKAN